jgi:hypothetical protein
MNIMMIQKFIMFHSNIGFSGGCILAYRFISTTGGGPEDIYPLLSATIKNMRIYISKYGGNSILP